MKQPINPKVPRTRNLGHWTEAFYWGQLRSALREAYRFWKPAQEALRRAGTKVEHKGRIITAYRCAKCGQWFRREGVQIDHVTPAGSLRDYADVGEFLRRLTAEDPKDFQVVCKRCHGAKTAEERAQRKDQRTGQIGLELAESGPSEAQREPDLVLTEPADG